MKFLIILINSRKYIIFNISLKFCNLESWTNDDIIVGITRKYVFQSSLMHLRRITHLSVVKVLNLLQTLLYMLYWGNIYSWLSWKSVYFSKGSKGKVKKIIIIQLSTTFFVNSLGDCCAIYVLLFMIHLLLSVTK